MFKDDLLAGKRVLVTGGGTGLGRSITQRYMSLCARVVICGRREDVLKQKKPMVIDGDGRIVLRPIPRGL